MINTDNVIKKFNDDGFVILKSVFGKTKIQEFLREINKLSKKLKKTIKDHLLILLKIKKLILDIILILFFLNRH